MTVDIKLGAPQALWIALHLLLIVCVGILHGTDKPPAKYNVGVTILDAVLSFAWLWWGGFF